MEINEPSAEFDAWLAEHVMGWRLSDGGGDLHTTAFVAFAFTRSYEGASSKCWKGNFVQIDNGNLYTHRFEVWSPSRNITHAWDVIERILSFVGSERDDIHGENVVNRFYYALLKSSVGGLHCYLREKAALMICQAAYEAFNDAIE
jgi:hypothetical protein